MHKKHLDWYRQETRGYVHFDSPMPRNDATKLVTDTETVKSRAFWPLISYSIRQRAWQKKPGTNSATKGRWKKKRRPIAYASHADAHIFAYYSHILSQSYEDLLAKHSLNDTVLAYRRIPTDHPLPGKSSKGKCNIHFAAEAFATVVRLAPCTAIAIDIKSFFDEIPHSLIKKNWQTLLNSDSLPDDHYAVYKAATKFATVPITEVRRAMGIGKRKFRKARSVALSCQDFNDHIRQRGVINVNRSGKGIPQGLPISGLLANLAMLEVDRQMSELAKSLNASYRRYSDDILIIAKPGNAILLADRLRNFITQVGLTIQDHKTCVSEFTVDSNRIASSQPLSYLGFEFDGEHVTIRPSTLVKFRKRMRSAVERARRSALKSACKGGKRRIRRRDLYARYSHLRPHPETPSKRRPRGSFVKYAGAASIEFDRCLTEERFKNQILRQLRRQWPILIKLIEEADESLQT